MELHGYNPNGPDTLGAEYARSHKDDLPDNRQPDGHVVPVGRARFVVGEDYRFEGDTLRLLYGQPARLHHDAALLLDARAVPAPLLARRYPTGRLLLWRGYYWRVGGINGVNLLLVHYGSSRRRHGWRLYRRNGCDMVARAHRPS